jgi:hypothetical protein
MYSILIESGIPIKQVRLIKMCLNETYSKVHIGKNLSDAFPIQNGLNQGDALLSMLFNFAINGTHQLLVYAYYINILGESTNTIQKSTEALLQANMEVVLEVKVEKTKHMVVSSQQNVRQNHTFLIANKFFEIVVEWLPPPLRTLLAPGSILNPGDEYPG